MSCNYCLWLALYRRWKARWVLGTCFALQRSMKVAIPVWQDRVSPVFDVAGRLLLVDVANRQEIGRNAQTLGEIMPHVRIRRMVEMGVDTLICAGISQPLEAGLADYGICVIG